MPEGIIDNTGTGYGLKVLSGGAALVSNVATTDPTSVTNPSSSLGYVILTSGTASGFLTTGSVIGSMFCQFDTGSFVKVLTYNGNLSLLGLGEWVAYP